MINILNNIAIKSLGRLSLIALVVFSISCTNNRLTYQVSVQETGKYPDVILVKVFLETSVSMKGYVNVNQPGNYLLSETVHYLVTDIKSKIAPVQLFTVTDMPSIYPSSNDSFYQSLRTGTLFSGQTSKLHNVFNQVIDNVRNNEVGIIITDCILDLGPDDNNLTERSDMVTQIYDHIINKEIAVGFFQYLSDFNGDHYYNRINSTPMPYAGQIMRKRPFYIWVVGNKTGVKKILKNNIFRNYQYSHFFGTDFDNLSLTLLPQPRKGKIIFDGNKNDFTCQEVSPKYPILITLGLNLKDLPPAYQDVNYLTKNLQLSNKSLNCIIKIFDSAGIQNQKNFNLISKQVEMLGLTHFFMLEFNNLNSDDSAFSLILNKEFPVWINNVSLDDDVNLGLKSLEGKTFSFKHLVGAFERKFGNEHIFKINFKLQPKK